MQRFAFAGGGREYRCRVRGIAAGIPKCFLPHGKGELDRDRRTAPLGGGEQLACDYHRGSRVESRRARQGAAARLPAGQARTEQTDAFDESPHHGAAPNTRLQLLPPKPNELVSA